MNEHYTDVVMQEVEYALVRENVQSVARFRVLHEQSVHFVVTETAHCLEKGVLRVDTDQQAVVLVENIFPSGNLMFFHTLHEILIFKTNTIHRQ